MVRGASSAVSAVLATIVVTSSAFASTSTTAPSRTSTPAVGRVDGPPRALATASPWSSDTILAGSDFGWFGGIEPGAQSTGTGIADLGTGFAASFSGFGGGLANFYHMDREVSARFDGLARLKLGISSPAGSASTGWDVLFSTPAMSGEYLYYVTPSVFLGAWGGLSGATIGKSKIPGATSSSPTVYEIPLRGIVGVGMGRIYPVHWRVLLKRLAFVLRQDGAIAGEIPDVVQRRILVQWYEDRKHLEVPPDPENIHGASHHRQVLSALQILKDENLLVKPAHPLAAYRMERIITDPNAVEREEGWDLRVGFRVSYTANSTSAPNIISGLALGAEVRYRAIFNLSLDSDLRFEPFLGVAPRIDDEVGNRPPSPRLVSFLTPGSAFLNSGRVVVDLPATYVRYVYDPSYNMVGKWELLARASGGYADQDGGALGIAAGAAYTFRTESRSGYTLGLTGSFGYRAGFRYDVGIVAAFGEGTGGFYYTAPDQVGDDVPFDASWLPRPGEE